MDEQRNSANRYRAILAVETALFSISTFILSYTLDDVLDVIFNFRPTIWIILTLVLWNVMAWVVRIIWVGNIRGIGFNGQFVVVFVLLRIGFLFSIVILLAGWLIAVVVDWPLAAVFPRAALLLMVVSFILTIAGGAFINSLLAHRKWRQGVAL